MDDLDRLLAWVARLDRITQFEALNQLQTVIPAGWVRITGLVNDPALPPLITMLAPVVAACPTPSQRSGLRAALAAWFDLMFTEGSLPLASRAPLRSLASGKDMPPITDEQRATMIAMMAFHDASNETRWTDAVRSWKEFRHAHRSH